MSVAEWLRRPSRVAYGGPKQRKAFATAFRYWYEDADNKYQGQAIPGKDMLGHFSKEKRWITEGKHPVERDNPHFLAAALGGGGRLLEDVDVGELWRLMPAEALGPKLSLWPDGKGHEVVCRPAEWGTHRGEGCGRWLFHRLHTELRYPLLAAQAEACGVGTPHALTALQASDPVYRLSAARIALEKLDVGVKIPEELQSDDELLLTWMEARLAELTTPYAEGGEPMSVAEWLRRPSRVAYGGPKQKVWVDELRKKFLNRGKHEDMKNKYHGKTIPGSEMVKYFDHEMCGSYKSQGSLNKALGGDKQLEEVDVGELWRLIPAEALGPTLNLWPGSVATDHNSSRRSAGPWPDGDMAGEPDPERAWGKAGCGRWLFHRLHTELRYPLLAAEAEACGVGTPH
eukprot:SAG22_NODE_2525_length_2476_cov_1.147244_3_plen_399_part_01